MVKWFDRIFDFKTSENILPSLIERLEGTPIRLSHKVRGFSPDFLIHKTGASWSVQEHIGHLIDLEPLWQGRLEDILDGAAVMREADLANRKTHEANHNHRDIHDLMLQFQEVRMNTVQRLQSLTEKQVFLQAEHPRLKIPMRTLDLFYFAAEHDDHHLAAISQLAKSR